MHALQGLDTDQPEICLSDGQCLVGEYEDNLGTQMFLEEPASRISTSDSKLENQEPHVLGMTDKTIKFKDKNLTASISNARPGPSAS